MINSIYVKEVIIEGRRGEVAVVIYKINVYKGGLGLQ